MARITRGAFLSDRQGRRFSDVVNDPRLDFDEWLKFLNSPARQQRLMDSEQDHGRPALAGIIKELENDDAFRDFLSKHDAHTTRRGRQAIGVLVRMIMEAEGWEKTWTKGSLGTRAKVAPRSTTPGAYRNRSGLSLWF